LSRLPGVNDTVAGLLERALEDFERFEDEQVLLRLLEAWREARAERIARLAERLTEGVCGPAPVILGPLGEPGQYKRILFPGPEETCSLYVLRSRLESLLQHPADPRFTSLMLAIAALPLAWQEEVFLPLCEAFIHLKDSRALEPLRALRARLPPGSPYGEQLGLTLERLGAEGLPLSAAASSLCDALEGAMARREQAVQRGAPRRDELLAHVGAHPEDDGARLVLADHLLEHGDPLGEFIALQCQPKPDDARLQRLLLLHRWTWGALLGPYIMPGWTRFKRGLPESVRMELRPGQHLPPPGPFWCAVRELDWDGGGGEAHADWLSHPNLRNVTVLANVPLRLAARLSTHPLPVRELMMEGDVIRRAPGVFNSLASLPHLARLEVTGATLEDVHLCASSPLARRLGCEILLDGGPWRLLGAPAERVPVQAVQTDEAHSEVFAEVLRAAVGFGTQALHIHHQGSLAEGRQRLLREASAAYARVDWNFLPPPPPWRESES
jgi:uncharacterized protein (TIGR02996 family)